MTSYNKLDLKSGIGLVVANMFGAGVLISSGFMAQNMEAGSILLAWGLGLLLALCGANAYAVIATTYNRSGGEYLYLSELYHPFIGNMAGWGSLVLGFSAPIAIDAIAIGWFAKVLGVTYDPTLIGAIAIICLSCVHAFHFHTSKNAQNLLVIIKLFVIGGWVFLGLSKGNHHLPSWQPPEIEKYASIWEGVFQNQFWILYAFSGWNAVCYSASDFQNPSKEVPRAMIIGCTIVGLLYLIINWIFVANLTPASSQVVYEYGNEGYITLAHVLMNQLMGQSAANWVSLSIIIIFFSAMSAMTMVGPRVYAEMAKDGFMPSFMKQKDGRPPILSITLQMVVALIFLYTHSLLEVVKSSSLLLMFFTALSVAGVWVMKKRGEIVSNFSLLSATIYMILVAWIIWYGLSLSGGFKLLGTFFVITIFSLLSVLFKRKHFFHKSS